MKFKPTHPIVANKQNNGKWASVEWFSNLKNRKKTTKFTFQIKLSQTLSSSNQSSPNQIKKRNFEFDAIPTVSGLSFMRAPVCSDIYFFLLVSLLVLVGFQHVTPQ